MNEMWKDRKTNGWWAPDAPPEAGDSALREALFRVRRPIFVGMRNGRIVSGSGGRAVIGGYWPTEAPAPDGVLPPGAPAPEGMLPLLAYAPPLPPEALGDPGFRRNHGLRYAYVAGAMANGITSVNMVTAMARAGMIGFFGAGGLGPEAIEAAVVRLRETLGEAGAWGVNLIHSPGDPLLEAATVDLYLRHNVRRVSASAYLNLTEPLIRYRLSGIHADAEGRVICPNKVVGKVSRVEVARRFLSPPPEKLVARLLEKGRITPEAARLAARIPVAEDLTAEADSGGHTDNQPALALLPTMIALRDEMTARHAYERFPRVGLGGGIATPQAAAAAFAMGAAYVLTGSINQSCVEAGTSERVRRMLAEACQADITMAPAADMFEMGVKVQVLKRGTMFPQRAARLYEIYRAHDRWESVPADQRAVLERDFFRCSFADEWAATRAFFERRNPSHIDRAERDPRHRMALVFRSYLGRASGWATGGVADRVIDYQVWCGPSLGAFNEWVRGTFLEKPENRGTAEVAMNLMFGAAVATRAAALRNQGIALSPAVEGVRPMTLETINAYLQDTEAPL